jgi:DNA-directed RNA polymerase subunit RPC12/RpoP
MLPSERESYSRRSEFAAGLTAVLHDAESAADHRAEIVRTSNDLRQVALFLIASSNDRIAGRPRRCEDCRVRLKVFFNGPFGTIYRCARCHAVIMEPSEKSRG